MHYVSGCVCVFVNKDESSRERMNGLSAYLDIDSYLSLGSQDCGDLEDLLVTPDTAQDS